jgi:cobalt-zinc-cadmium efflux system outer membrane protein
LLPNPVFDAGIFFPLDGGSARLDVGLSQNVLALLSRPARKQAARSDLEAVQFRVAGEVVDLVARVRAAFYRVQADQDLARLLQQLVRATTASADVAKAIYEAGNSTALDRDGNRILLEETRLAAITAQAQLAADRERLIRLLGLSEESAALRVADGLLGVPENVRALADIEQRGVEANLDLKAMKRKIEAQAARLRLGRVQGLIPDLEAGPAAERDGGWDLGPSVSFPIPIFNHGQGNRMARISELRRLRQEYVAQAIDVRSAARELRVRLHQSHAAAVQVERVLLPLRRAVMGESQLEYNAGQSGVFDLLRNQQAVIATAQRNIEALYQFWLLRAQADALLNGRVVLTGEMQRDVLGSYEE